MGLCVLAGAAFAECLRIPQRAVPALLARVLLIGLVPGLMYIQYERGDPDLLREPLPAEYPLWELRPPAPALLQVLQRPGGPVLEGPVSGIYGALHARAMYHSTFHWRPLLNGYSSFRPAGFDERMRLAARLPDPDALAALRRETGLELLLMHAEKLRPAERDTWLALAEHGGHGLSLVARDGDDILFAVGDPDAAR